jgi:GNAT superfamily N-acetyltransferase
MFSRPPDRFEEWLHVPLASECPDPRFDVRRVGEADFERVYDLVAAAFGHARERAVNDWLYRRNVSGKARCWAVVERATGSFVGVDTNFPWPIAHGERLLYGSLTGDFAIAPRWQRQGISKFVYDCIVSCPWRAEETVIGWPNAKSRGSGKKHGHGHHQFGPLPRAVLALRADQCFAALGVPRALSAAGGLVAQAALTVLWRARLRGGAAVRVEAIRRFDASFNAVTERCMAWPDFWCPHDAEFLNWRYLDNPKGGYVALATLDGMRPTGYGVLHVVGDHAWLTELVAPEQPAKIRQALVAEMIRVAREAGCARLEFFATPRWRHWRWLHSVGFVRWRSEFALYVNSPPELQAHNLDAWQLLPGDTEVL